jgi:hypothetical protein
MAANQRWKVQTWVTRLLAGAGKVVMGLLLQLQ